MPVGNSDNSLQHDGCYCAAIAKIGTAATQEG